jgi:ribosomal protein S4
MRFSMKKRLDVLLTERGLAPSREKAKALIMAGIVYVNNQKEDKAGTSFPEDVVRTSGRKGKNIAGARRFFLCGKRHNRTFSTIWV